MAQISAYLNFAGKCHEAMSFYHECFGGELNIQTVAESPMAGQMPAEMNGLVLHSSLINNGLLIMATDMTREKPINGNTIYLCINCCTEEEINSFFNKLSVGGQVVDPLAQMFWGTFGTLIDKFGMKWMFNYDKNIKQ